MHWNGLLKQDWADHLKKGRQFITVLYILIAAPAMLCWLSLICSSVPSIVYLMETWLTPSVDDTEIALNNLTVFRVDRV